MLNGTSSSGKSSLARALQSELVEVYLHCTLDLFWNMTPSGVPAGSVNFPKMKLAMAYSVRALAVTGHNVIVDTIYNGNKSHQEMVGVLGSVNLLTVKVFCQDEELFHREKARGDRKIGLARSQLVTVHTGIVYDIEIDTTSKSVKQSAQQVITYL